MTFQAPRSCARSLALGALLALGACHSDEPKKPDPEKLLEVHREAALQYFDQGELLRAQDQVMRGLDIQPDDAQLKLMLGWILQRKGTPKDVLDAERVFRDLAPEKDYRALLGLAESLERKGLLYAEAADAVESGSRTTEAPDPTKRVAELRKEAQDYWSESVVHYQTTLAQRPSEGKAKNGLQRVYALLGQSEKSLEWAQQLLEQTGAEIEFWKKQLQRPDLTARDEDRLRSLLKASAGLEVETHIHSSTLLLELGRKDEAVAHLDKVLALAPERADGYSRRAQILFELGRFEEAIADIDEFLRLSNLDFEHPDIRRAYQLRSDCEAALKQNAH
jgi:tetratricopeptide (TPR) repeat protein